MVLFSYWLQTHNAQSEMYVFDVPGCLRVCLLSRYLKRRKTIADLSEPMKNMKRKAWREAARRHRARKTAEATVTHIHMATQNNM